MIISGWAPLVLENPGLTYKLESTSNYGCRKEISEGEALANKECLYSEVALEDTNSLEGGCLSGVDVLLIIGVTANKRAEPRPKFWQNLGVGK